MAMPDTHVELPAVSRHPLRTIGERLALALGLVVLVALLAYIGRDGYIDPEDGGVSLLDAFYYSTVTITTTGYGDIRPVSDDARLATTIVITPARGAAVAQPGRGRLARRRAAALRRSARGAARTRRRAGGGRKP
jgi:hypothetical protein